MGMRRKKTLTLQPSIIAPVTCLAVIKCVTAMAESTCSYCEFIKPQKPLSRVFCPVRYDMFIHIDGFTKGKQYFYALQLFFVIKNNVFPQLFHFVSVTLSAWT